MEHVANPYPTDNHLLTTQELAAVCRTSASTVRYWRYTGYGPPGFRAGRRVLYRSTDVTAWLKRRADQEANK